MLHKITSHLMTTNNFVDKHLNVTCVLSEELVISAHLKQGQIC